MKTSPDLLLKANAAADAAMKALPPQMLADLEEHEEAMLFDAFARVVCFAFGDPRRFRKPYAPPSACFSVEVDVDRLPDGESVRSALRAALQSLSDRDFLAGPVEVRGVSVGAVGYGPAEMFRGPATSGPAS